MSNNKKTPAQKRKRLKREEKKQMKNNQTQQGYQQLGSEIDFLTKKPNVIQRFFNFFTN